MTEHEFNDMIEDGYGTLWRYGGSDLWYPQEERQDGYEELEEISGPHTPVVIITKAEHEELLEIAAMYEGLCK